MRDRRFGDYCGHFRSNQHPDHLLGDRPRPLAGSAPAHRGAHPPDIADRDHCDRDNLTAEVPGDLLTSCDLSFSITFVDGELRSLISYVGLPGRATQLRVPLETCSRP